MAAPVIQLPSLSPSPQSSKSTPHRFRFFRAGGVDQVQLRDGRDIVNLGQLDKKLWVALAMPTKGVEFSARTLEILDADKDGRIRVPEILAAVAWVEATFRNPDEVMRGGDRLSVSAVKDEAVVEAMRRVLATVGKLDASEVTVDDVIEAATRFAALPLNGDGIVPAESTDDFEARLAIEDAIATVGSVPDRSGKAGIDQAKADAFFEACKAFAAWHARGEADAGLQPLGEGTGAAASALSAVRTKIDDYFVRCRLAAFDARAAQALNGTEAELSALGGKELNAAAPEVSRLPISHVEGGRALFLREGVNPAWAEALATFADQAAAPVLGRAVTSLTEADFRTIEARLAAHVAWQAERPVSPVDKLGIDRIRTLLGGGAAIKIGQLIKDDLAREIDHERIATVEKLVLFQRDLFKLLNNFVNFSEFYGRKKGVFQAGTLYLDGRSCDLCFEVTDAAKHASLASLAATYLAYCECTRPGGAKLTIAAAFTGGDSDNLMVGRNGVFYDRKGQDWDATITKIVANPISIREAFFAPYKKFFRMIEEQFQKRAAAADAESNAKLANAAQTTANADKAPVAAAPPPEKKMDVGTVAALGVAIGGIGALVTGVLSTFFGLGVWMPIGLVAVLLMISGPSMLLAYLKLRQRNLGPILDAGGWAINGRAKVNVPFGGVLTDIASLPPGSERALGDPYAEKSRPWKTYFAVTMVVVLGLMWFIGRLDGFLPGPVKSVHVLGKYAPAAGRDAAGTTTNLVTTTPVTPPLPAPAPAPAKP